MSALSFKIDAETDKLERFVSLLKELKNVLAGIPSSTKEFKVIDQQIGEMEARIEQAMQNIAKYQQQAAEVAAAPAAQTANASAVRAEEAAYKSLSETLAGIRRDKETIAADLLDEKAKLEGFKRQLDEINKAEKDFGSVSLEAVERRIQLTAAIEEQKAAVSKLQQELKKEIKQTQEAEGSINAMQSALGLMRSEYRAMSEEERNSPVGQQLKKNIQDLDAKLKELNGEIGNYQANVGDYENAIIRALGVNGKFADSIKEAIKSGSGMKGVFTAAASGIWDAVKAAGAFIATPLGAVLSVLATVLYLVRTNLNAVNDAYASSETAMNKYKSESAAVDSLNASINKQLEEQAIGLSKSKAKWEEIMTVFKAFWKLKNPLEAIREGYKNKELFEQLAKDQQALQKLNRKNIVENEQYNAKIATLRHKAMQTDKYSAEERKKFVEEAMRLTNLQYDNRKKEAELEKKIADTNVKLTPSSTEDLDKQAQANANLIKVETDRENALRALQMQFNRTSTQADRYTSSLEKQSDKTTDLIAKLAADAQQAEIDAMAEGAQKKLAQIKLDYDKREDEIRKRERELRKLQGGTLTDEQQAGFDIMRTANTMNRDTERRKVLDQQEAQNREMIQNEITALNEYLAKYGDYQEKRLAIAELYADKIANATNEGTRLSLEQEMKEALSELDIEARKTTSAISQLFGDMSDKTVAELDRIAERGKEALAFIKEGEWDESKGIEFGISKETFEILNQSPEKLKAVEDGIKNVQRAADSSRTVFGRMGKALANIFSGKGTKEDWDALAESMGEVSSIANTISGAFSEMGEAFGSKTLSGVADAFSTVADVANSTMQGIQTGMSVGGPLGAAIGGAIGLVTSLGKAIAEIHDKKKERNIQKLQGQVETLEKSYDKLGRAIDKSYSSDASNLINQQNELLKQQKKLIEMQIAEEEAKKKTDEEKIKQWREQLDEINDQIEDNVDKAKEAITGVSFDQFRSNFLDTLMDMESDSQDFADNFEKMLQRSIFDALLTNKYNKRIQDLYDKWSQYGKDGEFTQQEVEYLRNLQNQLAEDMKRDRDSLAEIYGWGKDSSLSAQTATQRGFQAMSQETGDELNGRFTAIQGDVHDIRGFMMEDTQHIVDIVVGIAAIRASVDSSVQISNDLLRYTVMIYLEVADISQDTAAMRADLASIKNDIYEVRRNTAGLS